ncbi:hypothetical protein BDZ91DRAFT_723725 [Kalaharituber pfeilii]|nr:hypothetical protein BDZ91DRAFT_723725 [Kalaharituber pfeilii]
MQIRSIPTLLAFRRSLAQTDKALTKSEDLTNREILVRWIEDVAKEGEDDRKYRQGVLSSLWSQ